MAKPYWIHRTADVNRRAKIGRGTKVWHHSQILAGASVGPGCSIGHNCFVGGRAKLGRGVKLESNIDVWDLVTLENYVFVGPSAVFTNDRNPRAKYPKRRFPAYGSWLPTLVRDGASIGANATILCGVTVGRWAMVGAGAIVTKDVPDYAIVVGTPAHVVGWICECGNKLPTAAKPRCRTCGRRYRKTKTGVAPLSKRS